MQFSMRAVFLVVLAVLSMALAMPVLQSRDVYNPHITFPAGGEVFKAGQTITVTWDTSSLPKGTPNKGMIVLGQLTKNSENLQIEHPLAEGFLLTDGYHQITFPANLTTQYNYIIDLFGDSGNISKKFTIKRL